MEEKKRVRKWARQSRKDLGAGVLKEASSKIICKLADIIETWDTDYFFFYYPLEGEVSLLGLAEILLEQGKKIAFPKVDGDSMEFYEVTGLASEFRKGTFSVMEPIGTVPVDWETGVAFFPGLAFDPEKNRVGYGKGYYDRYFSEKPEIRRIGVCLEQFFLDKVPAEEFDIRMHAICTEQSILID